MQSTTTTNNIKKEHSPSSVAPPVPPLYFLFFFIFLFRSLLRLPLQAPSQLPIYNYVGHICTIAYRKTIINGDHCILWSVVQIVALLGWGGRGGWPSCFKIFLREEVPHYSQRTSCVSLRIFPINQNGNWLEGGLCVCVICTIICIIIIWLPS